MKKNTFLLPVMAILLLSSCASRKNFVYLNDMELQKEYATVKTGEAKVQTGDRLSITVSCKNSELAIPFNSLSGGYQVKSDGDVAVADASRQKEKGYRVDKDGTIFFPIFGELRVAGLTLSGVQDLIRDKIVAGKYIADPSVSVEFLNFKVYMLGEVLHCGPLSMDGDRVTLIEALSMAGDITPKGRLDRVMVMRTTPGGGRQMFVNDMKSEKLLQSPTFYLQQNDVVYVEPKFRRSSGEDVGFKYASIILSAVSVLSWLFVYLK